MIITFTGPSGTGKTSIVQRLITAKDPLFRILTSYTTRKPRPNDLHGDFIHLDDAEFDRMRNENEFLWTADVAGTHYGTRRRSVHEALTDKEHFWVMILVPQVLPLLFKEEWRQRRPCSVISFFVNVSNEDILRRRMIQRGDTPEQAEARIIACRDFEQEARTSRVPYFWLDNSGEIAVPIQYILDHLSPHMPSGSVQ